MNMQGLAEDATHIYWGEMPRSVGYAKYGGESVTGSWYKLAARQKIGASEYPHQHPTSSILNPKENINSTL